MAEGWQGEVEFASGPAGFAYRPGEVIGTGPREALVGIANEITSGEIVALDEYRGYTRLGNVPDPVLLVGELRDRGIEAQPNHVLFADTCMCGLCPPHPSAVHASPVYASPVYASPVYASPVYASPVYASPVYASPVYASPVYASPVYASQYQRTGIRPSSARPCAEIAEIKDRLTRPAQANDPRIAVLDTGLASMYFRPDFLHASIRELGTDEPDEVADGALDPAAGHGTFIAGIIDQLAPGCPIAVYRVLSTLGAGEEWEIRRVMERAVDDGAAILNLSFSGYAFEHAHYLAAGVRYAQLHDRVVVASAGNDATCRPTIPGCLPGVIAVGALGPSGPAPFSNHGEWVRACAPGVDLVSTFFCNFDGLAPPAMGGDPDKFDDWAVWSGTSFAAPIVVGALARSIISGDSGSPREAVERVIDAPWLMRIPGLGTVVNIA